jgi:molybdenum cofactor biosynthesis enzyme MoaA
MPTVTVGEPIVKKEIKQLISFNLLHDVTSKQAISLTTKSVQTNF